MHMLRFVHVEQPWELTNLGVFKWTFNLNRNQIIHTSDHVDFYPVMVIYHLLYGHLLLHTKFTECKKAIQPHASVSWFACKEQITSIKKLQIETKYASLCLPMKAFGTKGTDCLTSEPCDKAQTVQEMKTLGVADDVGRRHRYFTRLYLVHSPGSQRKLKHYLLNHVLVKTNISTPSVQEDDLMQLSAPTLHQCNSD